MQGRLFLIHWNPTEANELATPLRQAGWEVEVEAEDGGRGSKNILENPPAAVLIFLRRLPSHGRETAKHLQSTPHGAEIPLIFVDGESTTVEQTRALFPEATYTDHYNLPRVLEQLSEWLSPGDRSL